MWHHLTLTWQEGASPRAGSQFQVVVQRLLPRPGLSVRHLGISQRLRRRRKIFDEEVRFPEQGRQR